MYLSVHNFFIFVSFSKKLQEKMQENDKCFDFNLIKRLYKVKYLLNQIYYHP